MRKENIFRKHITAVPAAKLQFSFDEFVKQIFFQEKRYLNAVVNICATSNKIESRKNSSSSFNIAASHYAIRYIDQSKKDCRQNQKEYLKLGQLH